MNKIALLIGNSCYPESPLQNPVNDARSLAEKLSQLGFNCKTCSDAKISEMDENLDEFGHHLNSYEVGLFFFAGHGLQIAGNNYLTALDTNFEKEVSVKYSSLPLDKVIEVMDNATNLTSIIILDACRSNPFERKWRGVESRGLAPVYAPKGTILAFATSPGQVALDGRENNGAYTSALLQHLTTQDIPIEELFKRVRNTLISSTKGKQVSWEHTSLLGAFYFNLSGITTEYVAEYSERAIADRDYRCPTGSLLRAVIADLKSYNWYTQNSAIESIPSIDLASCVKDDLFILGRNIYQAACGGSHSANLFVDNLLQNLGRLPQEVSFHILNGMSYEIYFDPQGKFRDRAKTEKFETILNALKEDLFSESTKFIQQSLKPYVSQLFYIPGSREQIVFNITAERIEEDQLAIAGIYLEGQNILYANDGESYFDPNEDKMLRFYKLQKIQNTISSAIIAPEDNLIINFVDHKVIEAGGLLFPYDYKIQRFSK